MYSTLVDSKTLKQYLHDPSWVIVDCRYDLADQSMGRNAWKTGHIPGAVYADLHDDLSGPPLTDHGRHPLPSVEQLNAVFSKLGIAHESQVVAYDQVSGSFAARLWWLLRYMGHTAVAVLDGGWPAWQSSGVPIHSGEESRSPSIFKGTPRTEWLVTVDRVPESRRLVDSRDPARYRGETEPLDKAAGHIPGAINRFWKDNLAADGHFKPASRLATEITGMLGAVPPQEAVFYCGSGVTACHNLLAVAHAGLLPSKLYAGSWSDWCSVPERPVATGAEPGSF